MKRMMVLLSTLMMVLSLVGCGSSDNSRPVAVTADITNKDYSFNATVNSITKESQGTITTCKNADIAELTYNKLVEALKGEGLVDFNNITLNNALISKYKALIIENSETALKGISIVIKTNNDKVITFAYIYEDETLTQDWADAFLAKFIEKAK